jgi:hypothetical protein
LSSSWKTTAPTKSSGQSSIDADLSDVEHEELSPARHVAESAQLVGDIASRAEHAARLQRLRPAAHATISDEHVAAQQLEQRPECLLVVERGRLLEHGHFIGATGAGLERVSPDRPRR